MPKPHTFPTLFDNLRTISISFLKKHEYLNRGHLKSGTISWSVNGSKTGSISIHVNTISECPYIQLEYNNNNEPINYKIYLVDIPSNLGKGVLWYFVCPKTGNRCRKLYLADTYFCHRSACSGCMYEKQTQSKKGRYLDKTLGVYFRTDQFFEQLYKKHLKKQYAGKPTKKYLKLTQQIQRAERIPYHEIERAFMS